MSGILEAVKEVHESWNVKENIRQIWRNAFYAKKQPGIDLSNFKRTFISWLTYTDEPATKETYNLRFYYGIDQENLFKGQRFLQTDRMSQTQGENRHRFNFLLAPGSGTSESKEYYYNLDENLPIEDGPIQTACGFILDEKVRMFDPNARIIRINPEQTQNTEAQITPSEWTLILSNPQHAKNFNFTYLTGQIRANFSFLDEDSSKETFIRDIKPGQIQIRELNPDEVLCYPATCVAFAINRTLHEEDLNQETIQQLTTHAILARDSEGQTAEGVLCNVASSLSLSIDKKDPPLVQVFGSNMYYNAG